MSEGFKYQLSSKVGDHMLNVRADDADEFRQNVEALFGEGAAAQVFAPFFVSSALGATTVEAPAVQAAPVQQPVAQYAPSGPAGGDAPTEKQIKFARQLGIDPTGMTKKSLSAAIDAKVKSQ